MNLAAIPDSTGILALYREHAADYWPAMIGLELAQWALILRLAVPRLRRRRRDAALLLARLREYGSAPAGGVARG